MSSFQEDDKSSIYGGLKCKVIYQYVSFFFAEGIEVIRGAVGCTNR